MHTILRCPSQDYSTIIFIYHVKCNCKKVLCRWALFGVCAMLKTLTLKSFLGRSLQTFVCLKLLSPPDSLYRGDHIGNGMYNAVHVLYRVTSEHHRVSFVADFCGNHLSPMFVHTTLHTHHAYQVVKTNQFSCHHS